LRTFIDAAKYHVSGIREKILLTPLTNNSVLERLVVPDRLAITFAFMFFTIEVLDRLIVEQAVRVDATRDLAAWIS
jgi:hypothetical protein